MWSSLWLKNGGTIKWLRLLGSVRSEIAGDMMCGSPLGHGGRFVGRRTVSEAGCMYCHRVGNQQVRSITHIAYWTVHSVACESARGASKKRATVTA
jgi:hypothetical protein